jgi:hypothetical protein
MKGFVQRLFVLRWERRHLCASQMHMGANALHCSPYDFNRQLNDKLFHPCSIHTLNLLSMDCLAYIKAKSRIKMYAMHLSY